MQNSGIGGASRFSTCAVRMAVYIGGLFSKQMLRPTFSILHSIVLAGVTLGFSALAGDRNLSEHNVVSPGPPALQPGVGTHESRADIEGALALTEDAGNALVEAVSSAPPTRSSFMATWQTIAGTNGYLLDVSTSSSFSTYVEGYHDLDVGNVTGRVVTGLNPGQDLLLPSPGKWRGKRRQLLGSHDGCHNGDDGIDYSRQLRQLHH